MVQDSHSGSDASLVSNTEHDLDCEEYWTLTGQKPFFDVILAKTHLHPQYRLNLPAKIHPLLPSITVPVVLTYGGEEWNMNYYGTSGGTKRFDGSWRKFVEDNGLKVGDACIFELKESSCKKLVFRVQVLRGDIPFELLSKIVGETVNSPIIIQ